MADGSFAATDGLLADSGGPSTEVIHCWVNQNTTAHPDDIFKISKSGGQHYMSAKYAFGAGNHSGKADPPMTGSEGEVIWTSTGEDGTVYTITDNPTGPDLFTAEKGGEVQWSEPLQECPPEI